MKRRILYALSGVCLCGAFALIGLWLYAGSYGVHVLLRHGGTYWISLKTDDPRLSPSIRLALRDAPVASPGAFEWRTIDVGFEVAELPVISEGAEVDRIYLARIDPDRFRFEVLSAPAGDKDLDEWMAGLNAVLVINGSYYSKRGAPATPLLSDGELMGPRRYDANAGAFVSSPAFIGIRDLANQDWKTAFADADNAMVSFPLLLAADGTSRAGPDSRWLANRSFVGQDKDGWVVLGTTTDAFFSLSRLAAFLQAAPLGLTLTLNLDGGPVACQAISRNGFSRKTYGRWELQSDGTTANLLVWPYGTVALPVVLAVFAK